MQLLLACLTGQPWKNGIDRPGWGEFLRLAERHKVSALAARGLQMTGLQPVPDEVHQRMAQAHRDQVRRCLSQVRELLRLLPALAEAGAGALPLKGPALSQQLYGDPCVRHSGDIDLLIDPAGIGRADDVLIGCGYTRLRPDFAPGDPRWAAFCHIIHHAVYGRPGSAPLELHWRLHPMRRLQPVAVSELLDTAGHVTFAGIRFPVLDPVDQLLFLAGHGARHNWFRLAWLCDIPALLAQMDEGQQRAAQRRAQKLGLERPLALALLMARQALAMPIPASLDTAALRDPVVGKLMVTAHNAITANAGKPALYPVKLFRIRLQSKLRLKRQLGYKLECVKIFLVDWRDVNALRLPVTLHFLYVLLRPVSWLRRRLQHWIPAAAGVIKK